MVAASTTVGRIGIWSPGLRYADPGEIAETAAELEELGFTALWVPDTGGELFDALERLLAATKTATIATGILNLWMHTPEETTTEYRRLVDAYGRRLMVGIGISHEALISAKDPGRYQRPLTKTREYLDALDAQPDPLAPGDRALAALGPKMLKLAAERTAGVHPYNVTPEHTAIAREALGDQGLVMPEQAVALATDATEARRLGRNFLHHYLQLPNYTNNLLRLGFTEADLADGGSDALIDAVVAWGDDSAIAARIQEHRDAGADHVCIQVLSDGLLPRPQWRELAPALVS